LHWPAGPCRVRYGRGAWCRPIWTPTRAGRSAPIWMLGSGFPLSPPRQRLPADAADRRTTNRGDASAAQPRTWRTVGVTPDQPPRGPRGCDAHDPSVGNYDYVIDWADEAGSTASMSCHRHRGKARTMADPTARQDTAYGGRPWLGSIDHFLSFRLDVATAWANTLVEKVGSLPREQRSAQRRDWEGSAAGGAARRALALLPAAPLWVIANKPPGVLCRRAISNQSQGGAGATRRQHRPVQTPTSLWYTMVFIGRSLVSAFRLQLGAQRRRCTGKVSRMPRTPSRPNYWIKLRRPSHS
jgi:hypothetical protein